MPLTKPVPITPIKLFLRGFDWHGKSSRKELACVAVTMAVLAMLLLTNNSSFAFSGQKATALVLWALFTVPYVGHCLRRLSDMGRSGWWVWCMLVPVASLVLVVVLVVSKPSDKTHIPSKPLRRLGLGFACCFATLVFSRMFWTPYWIPAGSMKPTLLVGDFVIATPIRGNVERGDVLIFTHPVKGSNYIKRVVALGGETVQLKAGVLFVNGEEMRQAPAGNFEEIFEWQGAARHFPRCANGPVGAGQTCIKLQYLETLPSGVSYNVLDINAAKSDNTPVYTVPEKHLFFLGDNRDNSSDSRFAHQVGGLGFVPARNLLYRANVILFSSQGATMATFWRWRADRFWKRIQ